LDVRARAKLYQCIRDNGGFENWDMVEVEKYEATDKQDLHKRERYWIETLKSSLNRVIPTQGRKEHYQVHKERINDISRQYYVTNNAKYGIKVTCECGTIINNSSLCRHKKTKKHLDLMELVK